MIDGNNNYAGHLVLKEGMDSIPSQAINEKNNEINIEDKARKPIHIINVTGAI